MSEQSHDETNKIITKFVCEFTRDQIQSIGLNSEKLSNSAINEIFYRRHQDLTGDQIASIDCSKLDDVCITILFGKHLQKISQHNVDTLSDVALKHLTSCKL